MFNLEYNGQNFIDVRRVTITEHKIVIEYDRKDFTIIPESQKGCHLTIEDYTDKDTDE